MPPLLTASAAVQRPLMSEAARALFSHTLFTRITKTQSGILVLARSQRKPIFRIEEYLRIIFQCNESWTPYIDGLLPHMMFDGRIIKDRREMRLYGLKCRH